MRALTRSGSDHTPLLINFGHQAHLGNKPHFSFELSWLMQDGFCEMTKNKWDSAFQGGSPLETWQNKIRHMRHFLKDG
jgi:hypothetical protein